MLSNNLKFKLFASLIIILIGAVVLWEYPPFESLEVFKCNWTKTMMRKKFQGVVIKKYEDENNHLKPTLKIQTNSSAEFITFTNEKSGFYNHIELNDSIIKNPNNLSVAIYRDGKRKYWMLDYGCADN